MEIKNIYCVFDDNLELPPCIYILVAAHNYLYRIVFVIFNPKHMSLINPGSFSHKLIFMNSSVPRQLL